MKRKLLPGLFIALMVSSVAMAADKTGFYVGGGIGSAGIQVDPDELIGSSDEEFDEGDTGWKVFGGWRPITFVSVEISYVDFGNPSGDLGSIDSEVGVNAFNAQAVGYIPIGFIDIFAKAGYYYWNADVDTSSFGGDSESDWDFNYGAGIGFNFSRIGIRAEYERFEIGIENGDASADLFSASALFRF